MLGEVKRDWANGAVGPLAPILASENQFQEVFIPCGSLDEIIIPSFIEGIITVIYRVLFITQAFLKCL